MISTLLTARRIRVLLLTLCTVALGSGLTFAHVEPAGCGANNLNLNVMRSRSSVINGDVVNYTVQAMNSGLGACNVESAEVVFICPDINGDPAGPLTTLSAAGGDDFPADGTGDTIYPDVACTITVTPGIGSANAAAASGDRVNTPPTNLSKGVLHDSPSDNAFNIEKLLAVEVMTCESACGTSDECVDRGCNADFTCFVTDNSAICGMSDACVERSCDPAMGCVVVDFSGDCDPSDDCVDRSCDPVMGCVEDDHSSLCGSDDTCVLRGCDPVGGCFEDDRDPVPDECMPVGCRITAGGVAPDGGMDTGQFADIKFATFGGQVGAPCGCSGCFDQLDHIQGSWAAFAQEAPRELPRHGLQQPDLRLRRRPRRRALQSRRWTAGAAAPPRAGPTWLAGAVSGISIRPAAGGPSGWRSGSRSRIAASPEPGTQMIRPTSTGSGSGFRKTARPRKRWRIRHAVRMPTRRAGIRTLMMVGI